MTKQHEQTLIKLLRMSQELNSAAIHGDKGKVLELGKQLHELGGYPAMHIALSMPNWGCPENTIENQWRELGFKPAEPDDYWHPYNPKVHNAVSNESAILVERLFLRVCKDCEEKLRADLVDYPDFEKDEWCMAIARAFKEETPPR